MMPVRRWEYTVGLALGVLFLGPLLLYGHFDHEELPLGIFATQIHFRELAHGRWTWWLNNLGFGTPLPIGHRLELHPAFAFASVASLRMMLSALWLGHMAVMVIYFLRLAAVTGLRPPLRIILLALYVFSAVTLCWFYLNDWVTFVIGWSLYPVLVFYLRQAVLGEAETRFWPAALRLALLSGFLVLNSHPGYIAPLALTLAVYAVAAAPLRKRVYACLLVAFALGVAMSLERVYYFASEMQLFPATSWRLMQPEYALRDYVGAAFAPFTSFRGNMRLPFTGLVIGGAAWLALLRLRTVGDRHVRACAIVFAAAFVLSVLPHRLVSLWIASSGAWLFRDPMVFFGLLIGGLVLQRELESPHALRRKAAWALVAVQAGQQAATIQAGYVEYMLRAGELRFYRHQGEAGSVGGMLVRHAAAFGPRLYLSQYVHDLTRGVLAPHGLYAVTDLVFLGLAPINAWFKVVSMDRLYPSLALMHGQIVGQRDVVENRTLLDVLGVNMVVVAERDDLAPAGLVPVDRMVVKTAFGADTLLLFGNPDAWPQAVLLEPAARTLELPLRPSCPHRRALCRDYDNLLRTRLATPVALTASNGRYDARFAAAHHERVLFVSAMYRPEWEARSSAGVLRIDPVAGAFLGVTVPPGVDEVEVTFVPRMRIALAWFSGLTFLVALIAFGATLQRREKRHHHGARAVSEVGR